MNNILFFKQMKKTLEYIKNSETNGSRIEGQVENDLQLQEQRNLENFKFFMNTSAYDSVKNVKVKTYCGDNFE